MGRQKLGYFNVMKYFGLTILTLYVSVLFQVFLTQRSGATIEDFIFDDLDVILIQHFQEIKKV